MIKEQGAFKKIYIMYFRRDKFEKRNLIKNKFKKNII